jgi:hypothetical protein
VSSVDISWKKWGIKQRQQECEENTSAGDYFIMS